MRCTAPIRIPVVILSGETALIRIAVTWSPEEAEPGAGAGGAEVDGGGGVSSVRPTVMWS
jgi:hypothetical protein